MSFAGGLRHSVSNLGASTLELLRDVGGIVILTFEVLKRLALFRLDGRELVSSLYKMGNKSVPIVCLTAFFVGGLMIIQAGIFVEKFSATSLVGWGAGYTIFRELGPVLIALMFSGRVGSNNTAELGHHDRH